jgi:hypothetical protein
LLSPTWVTRKITKQGSVIGRVGDHSAASNARAWADEQIAACVSGQSKHQNQGESATHFWMGGDETQQRSSGLRLPNRRGFFFFF